MAEPKVAYRVQVYFQPHGETPGEWVSLSRRGGDHTRTRNFDSLDAAKARMRVLVADRKRVVKVTITETEEEVA